MVGNLRRFVPQHRRRQVANCISDRPRHFAGRKFKSGGKHAFPGSDAIIEFAVFGNSKVNGVDNAFDKHRKSSGLQFFFELEKHASFFRFLNARNLHQHDNAGTNDAGKAGQFKNERPRFAFRVLLFWKQMSGRTPIQQGNIPRLQSEFSHQQGGLHFADVCEDDFLGFFGRLIGFQGGHAVGVNIHRADGMESGAFHADVHSPRARK